jgi:hypothetical protein
MACERLSGGDSFITGAEAIDEVDETTELMTIAAGASTAVVDAE